MCCESCPDYEDCAARDRLKDGCCKKCPDYNMCFPAEESHDDETEEIY